MVPQSLDSVTIVGLEFDGSRSVISFSDDDTRSIDFDLWFEDVHGIKLLVGADPLTRWLMARGKLWALSPIRDLIELATNGKKPELPHVIQKSTSLNN